MKLEFFKPFAAINTAEFTFQSNGNQTMVTCNMFGEKKFIAKAMHLFTDMDQMIGDQFEKGLARMKSLAEAAPGQSCGEVSLGEPMNNSTASRR